MPAVLFVLDPVLRFILHEWAWIKNNNVILSLFCFQYFVFDFHMPPVMLFDKIITLSVRILTILVITYILND